MYIDNIWYKRIKYVNRELKLWYWIKLFDNQNLNLLVNLLLKFILHIVVESQSQSLKANSGTSSCTLIFFNSHWIQSSTTQTICYNHLIFCCYLKSSKAIYTYHTYIYVLMENSKSGWVSLKKKKEVAESWWLKSN